MRRRSVAAEKGAEVLALPEKDRAFLVRQLIASLAWEMNFWTSLNTPCGASLLSPNAGTGSAGEAESSISTGSHSQSFTRRTRIISTLQP